jgi:N-acetylglucosaminyl-diphospho-decaprenol L-rhamnosyltransferase
MCSDSDDGPMKICAVVLNYRGASMTESCLLSLIGQGLHTVVIVDNSADAHYSMDLNPAIQRVREAGIDYDLRTLVPAMNLGFAGGVNFALTSQVARDCDAFLLLNNDATASPNMVAQLSALLVKNRAALVAPTIVDENGKAQPIFWYQRFFGLLTTYPLPGAFPYLSGCCFLSRRDLLQENKLFDEDFFMYGEDTLLGWRMANARNVILHHPDVWVYHAGRGSSKKCRLFYEYHMTRAHILLAMKTWHKPVELPLLITAKGIGLALRALRRTIRFRSAVPLVAFLIAWFPLDIRAS